MPLVSVVMPVFNGEKYLAEAIESILAQTFSDLELLIVDDGSQDKSAEIIQAYVERDSRVCFMQLSRNSGIADAKNLGLAAAKGDYITGMDCDDISLPERLEKQVSFMQSNPEVGAVGICCRVVNHDLTTTRFDFIVPQAHALIALNLFFGAGFVGASVMLRREFLTAVGGFEPGRRLNEDLELFMRLLERAQIKFANLPEILMLYRRHEQSLSAATNASGDLVEREIRGRMLKQLWHEAPKRTLDRFQSLRRQEKLSWTDRQAARRDITRLIESMIAHNWVMPRDQQLLLSAMNRRLEQASPRLWQQFCHWRRHHFQRR